MKKILLFLCMFCFLFLLPSSVSAEVSWPPPPSTSVPTSIIIPDAVLSNVFSTLSGTIKSLGYTGFMIVSLLVSVMLFPLVFKILFTDHIRFKQGLSRKVLNRQIEGADMKLNEAERTNFDIRRRVFNRNTDMLDMNLNEGQMVELGVRRRKLNRAISAADFERNFDDLVEERMRSKEVSEVARRRYRQRSLSNSDKPVSKS